MRAFLQRVAWAKVEVEGAVVGAIDQGLLVLLGVSHEDSLQEVTRLAAKVSKLRVFEDSEGKMNLSVKDVRGGVLVVSQFTLLADARRGNRPSFSAAAPPERAERLYLAFADELRGHGLKVATGLFGAHMSVLLHNDGPVSLMLDTHDS